jgi:hypothetical protein
MKTYKKLNKTTRDKNDLIEGINAIRVVGPRTSEGTDRDGCCFGEDQWSNSLDAAST